MIHKRSGTTEIEGKTVTIRSPAEALSAGVQVAFLPEERKTQGIFGDLAVRSNIVMSALGRVGSMGFASRKNERKLYTDIAGPVDLQDRYLEFQIKDLSGGNQQKALLGRVLLTGQGSCSCSTQPVVLTLALNRPCTRQLEDFVRGGGAVLLYSSELAELVRLSDRCLVIYEGRIAAELVGDAIQETALVAAATGHSHHSAGAVA